jgi:hypothetical protein
MKFKISSLVEIRDNIFVLLLIANSGLPFFTNEPYFLLASLIIAIPFLKPSILLTKKIYWITLILLSLLVLGQSLTFGELEIRSTFTLFIRWTYPFIILAIVKDRFPRILVNIIYSLTIISLIFFIPSLVFPELDNILLKYSRFFDQQPSLDIYEYRSNVLVYTVYPVYAIENIAIFKRNSGPFWEAGAFGCYLMITLIISYALHGNLMNKKNVIFIIAIITTWSTPSLIALLIFIFMIIVFIDSNISKKMLIIPILIITAFQLYNNASFVKDRVDRSIFFFQERDNVENLRRDRMVSAIVDIETFKDYPIFGTGRDSKMRFGTSDISLFEHRNNGLTDFLVKYGFFFFILYFGKFSIYFIKFQRYIIKDHR